MRFGFVTCVQLGLSCMEAIYSIGGSLALAMTLPDDKAVRKSGRVYLDEFCNAHSIPLTKVPHINSPEAMEALRTADLDWLFIIGWSQIASPEILSIPSLGALGMHPTLLPVGRGRAAIPWAILLGLPETGVTLFKLDEGIDTGPVAGQRKIQLNATTTAKLLYEQAAANHISLICDIFPRLVSNTVQWSPQDESRATTWLARIPADGQINLNGSVWDAERLVRATTRPYPGAFLYTHGMKLTVWAATVCTENRGPSCIQFYDGFLLPLEVEEQPVSGCATYSD